MKRYFIIKIKNKFIPFFFVIFTYNAWVTQANGMLEWEDLFDQEKLHFGILIGPKILEKLDDFNLSQAACVTKNWRQFVTQIREKRLKEEKQRLFSHILEVVDAEPNEVERACKLIKQMLENPPPQSQFFASAHQKLALLYPRLLQPEFLIWKDALSDFLISPVPEKNHRALVSLVTLIKELKIIEEDFHQSQYSTQLQEIFSVFSELRIYYETYLKKLLLPDCNRSAFLQSKALLSGESFLGNEKGITSYRISQEMALSLLSKDRYGLLLKSNILGRGSIKKQEKVYFKGNTSNTGLPVGKESAVYWLMKILFGKGMAPTALLTLNEVDIRIAPQDTQARRDFEIATARGLTSDEFFSQYPQHYGAFTEINPDHMLQASLEVEGITLEEFMHGVENGKYDYNDINLNSFSEHIIMSLLTNPSDGTPDNFIVRTDQGKPYLLVGIDNDMTLQTSDVVVNAVFSPFIPGHKLTEIKKHSVEINNVLYCLPLMQKSISLKVRKRILQISPECMILQWLGCLKHQQASYDELKKQIYTKEEKIIPYMKESIYEYDLGLPIQFDPIIINSLLERFVQIQRKLQDYPTINHDNLFRCVCPLVHCFYKTLKAEIPTPIAAYQRINPPFDPPFLKKKFIEDVLSLKEKLYNNQTIEEALSFLPIHRYREKIQPIEHLAIIVLSKIDLFKQPFLYSILSSTIECFCDLFQKQNSLKIDFHPSWFSKDALYRAIVEDVPIKYIHILFQLHLSHNKYPNSTEIISLYEARKKSPHLLVALLKTYNRSK